MPAEETLQMAIVEVEDLVKQISSSKEEEEARED
jgi:hypothetical protein